MNILPEFPPEGERITQGVGRKTQPQRTPTDWSSLDPTGLAWLWDCIWGGDGEGVYVLSLCLFTQRIIRIRA